MSDLLRASAAPRTRALRRALGVAADARAKDDLLFMKTWATSPSRQLRPILRAHQIRRANPLLAAEIRAGRPLSSDERTALSLQVPAGSQ